MDLKVSIEDLKPGMVLSRPIRNKGPIVLFQAGHELTAREIERLSHWDVEYVYVESEAPRKIA
ncbi:MAG: hypothetical protein ABEK50_18260 [bacterium]